MTANDLAVYHGIFCCARDADFVVSHAGLIDILGLTAHCAYFTRKDVMPLVPQWEDLDIGSHRVGTDGGRDNLPLLTYGMMQHALTLQGWTHLLKTDCNIEVLSIDWEAVAKSDYAGCVTNNGIARCYLPAEREPILREPWRGKAPKRWCYGSAYVVSRKLAQLVVAHEDVMVACIAEEAGFTPVPAITYRDEYGVHASDII